MLVQKGNEVWLCQGKMEIHVLTYVDQAIVLQPVDPVMAKVMGLDVDEQYYPILETQYGPEKAPSAPE